MVLKANSLDANGLAEHPFPSVVRFRKMVFEYPVSNIRTSCARPAQPISLKQTENESAFMQTTDVQSSHFLTRADLRTLGLASIGGALEFSNFYHLCIFHVGDRKGILRRRSAELDS